MSGHSKWATTKHKKAVIDAKRGKLFAKLIKNIEVAARTGGGDPRATRRSTTPSRRPRRPRCRTTTSTARSSAGRGAEAGGADYQDDHVRGLRPRRRRGPHRVPDRQPQPRRAMEVRTAMTRNGGSMADPGSVSYLFNRKGVVVVPKADGARRGRRADGRARRRRRGGQRPRRLLRGGQRGRPTWSPCAPRCRTPASTTTRPTPRSCRACSVELDEDGAGKVFRLIDALEDCDDVQNVYANYDVRDEVMEQIDA